MYFNWKFLSCLVFKFFFNLIYSVRQRFVWGVFEIPCLVRQRLSSPLLNDLFFFKFLSDLIYKIHFRRRVMWARRYLYIKRIHAILLLVWNKASYFIDKFLEKFLKSVTSSRLFEAIFISKNKKYKTYIYKSVFLNFIIGLRNLAKRLFKLIKFIFQFLIVIKNFFDSVSSFIFIDETKFELNNVSFKNKFNKLTKNSKTINIDNYLGLKRNSWHLYIDIIFYFHISFLATPQSHKKGFYIPLNSSFIKSNYFLSQFVKTNNSRYLIEIFKRNFDHLVLKKTPNEKISFITYINGLLVLTLPPELIEEVRSGFFNNYQALMGSENTLIYSNMLSIWDDLDRNIIFSNLYSNMAISNERFDLDRFFKFNSYFNFGFENNTIKKYPKESKTILNTDSFSKSGLNKAPYFLENVFVDQDQYLTEKITQLKEKAHNEDMLELKKDRLLDNNEDNENGVEQSIVNEYWGLEDTDLFNDLNTLKDSKIDENIAWKYAMKTKLKVEEETASLKGEALEQLKISKANTPGYYDIEEDVLGNVSERGSEKLAYSASRNSFFDVLTLRFKEVVFGSFDNIRTTPLSIMRSMPQTHRFIIFNKAKSWNDYLDFFRFSNEQFYYTVPLFLSLQYKYIWLLFYNNNILKKLIYQVNGFNTIQFNILKKSSKSEELFDTIDESIETSKFEVIDGFQQLHLVSYFEELSNFFSVNRNNFLYWKDVLNKEVPEQTFKKHLLAYHKNRLEKKLKIYTDIEGYVNDELKFNIDEDHDRLVMLAHYDFILLQLYDRFNYTDVQYYEKRETPFHFTIEIEFSRLFEFCAQLEEYGYSHNLNFAKLTFNNVKKNISQNFNFIIQRSIFYRKKLIEFLEVNNFNIKPKNLELKKYLKKIWFHKFISEYNFILYEPISSIFNKTKKQIFRFMRITDDTLFDHKKKYSVLDFRTTAETSMIDEKKFVGDKFGKGLLRKIRKHTKVIETDLFLYPNIYRDLLSVRLNREEKEEELITKFVKLPKKPKKSLGRIARFLNLQNDDEEENKVQEDETDEYAYKHNIEESGAFTHLTLLEKQKRLINAFTLQSFLKNEKSLDLSVRAPHYYINNQEFDRNEEPGEYDVFYALTQKQRDKVSGRKDFNILKHRNKLYSNSNLLKDNRKRFILLLIGGFYNSTSWLKEIQSHVNFSNFFFESNVFKTWSKYSTLDENGINNSTTTNIFDLKHIIASDNLKSLKKKLEKTNLGSITLQRFLLQSFFLKQILNKKKKRQDKTLHYDIAKCGIIAFEDEDEIYLLKKKFKEFTYDVLVGDKDWFRNPIIKKETLDFIKGELTSNIDLILSYHPIEKLFNTLMYNKFSLISNKKSLLNLFQINTLIGNLVKSVIINNLIDLNPNSINKFANYSNKQLHNYYVKKLVQQQPSRLMTVPNLLIFKYYNNYINFNWYSLNLLNLANIWARNSYLVSLYEQFTGFLTVQIFRELLFDPIDKVIRDFDLFKSTHAFQGKKAIIFEKYIQNLIGHGRYKLSIFHDETFFYKPSLFWVFNKFWRSVILNFFNNSWEWTSQDYRLLIRWRSFLYFSRHKAKEVDPLNLLNFSILPELQSNSLYDWDFKMNYYLKKNQPLFLESEKADWANDHDRQVDDDLVWENAEKFEKEKLENAAEVLSFVPIDYLGRFASKYYQLNYAPLGFELALYAIFEENTYLKILPTNSKYSLFNYWKQMTVDLFLNSDLTFEEDEDIHPLSSDLFSFTNRKINSPITKVLENIKRPNLQINQLEKIEEWEMFEYMFYTNQEDFINTASSLEFQLNYYDKVRTILFLFKKQLLSFLDLYKIQLSTVYSKHLGLNKITNESNNIEKHIIDANLHRIIRDNLYHDVLMQNSSNKVNLFILQQALNDFYFLELKFLELTEVSILKTLDFEDEKLLDLLQDPYLPKINLKYLVRQNVKDESKSILERWKGNDSFIKGLRGWLANYKFFENTMTLLRKFYNENYQSNNPTSALDVFFERSYAYRSEKAYLIALHHSTSKFVKAKQAYVYDWLDTLRGYQTERLHPFIQRQGRRVYTPFVTQLVEFLLRRGKERTTWKTNKESWKTVNDSGALYEERDEKGSTLSAAGIRYVEEAGFGFRTKSFYYNEFNAKTFKKKSKRVERYLVDPKHKYFIPGYHDSEFYKEPFEIFKKYIPTLTPVYVERFWRAVQKYFAYRLNQFYINDKFAQFNEDEKVSLTRLTTQEYAFKQKSVLDWDYHMLSSAIYTNEKLDDRPYLFLYRSLLRIFYKNITFYEKDFYKNENYSYIFSFLKKLYVNELKLSDKKLHDLNFNNNRDIEIESTINMFTLPSFFNINNLGSSFFEKIKKRNILNELELLKKFEYGVTYAKHDITNLFNKYNNFLLDESTFMPNKAAYKDFFTSIGQVNPQLTKIMRAESQRVGLSNANANANADKDHLKLLKDSKAPPRIITGNSSLGYLFPTIHISYLNKIIKTSQAQYYHEFYMFDNFKKLKDQLKLVYILYNVKHVWAESNNHETKFEFLSFTKFIKSYFNKFSFFDNFLKILNPMILYNSNKTNNDYISNFNIDSLLKIFSLNNLSLSKDWFQKYPNLVTSYLQKNYIKKNNTKYDISSTIFSPDDELWSLFYNDYSYFKDEQDLLQSNRFLNEKMIEIGYRGESNSGCAPSGSVKFIDSQRVDSFKPCHIDTSYYEVHFEDINEEDLIEEVEQPGFQKNLFPKSKKAGYFESHIKSSPDSLNPKAERWHFDGNRLLHSVFESRIFNKLRTATLFLSTPEYLKPSVEDHRYRRFLNIEVIRREGLPNVYPGYLEDKLFLLGFGLYWPDPNFLGSEVKNQVDLETTLKNNLNISEGTELHSVGSSDSIKWDLRFLTNSYLYFRQTYFTFNSKGLTIKEIIDNKEMWLQQVYFSFDKRKLLDDINFFYFFILYIIYLLIGLVISFYITKYSFSTLTLLSFHEFWSIIERDVYNQYGYWDYLPFWEYSGMADNSSVERSGAVVSLFRMFTSEEQQMMLHPLTALSTKKNENGILPPFDQMNELIFNELPGWAAGKKKIKTHLFKDRVVLTDYFSTRFFCPSPHNRVYLNFNNWLVDSSLPYNPVDLYSYSNIFTVPDWFNVSTYTPNTFPINPILNPVEPFFSSPNLEPGKKWNLANNFGLVEYTTDIERAQDPLKDLFFYEKFWQKFFYNEYYFHMWLDQLQLNPAAFNYTTRNLNWTIWNWFPKTFSSFTFCLTFCFWYFSLILLFLKFNSQFYRFGSQFYYIRKFIDLNLHLLTYVYKLWYALGGIVSLPLFKTERWNTKFFKGLKSYVSNRYYYTFGKLLLTQGGLFRDDYAHYDHKRLKDAFGQPDPAIWNRHKYYLEVFEDNLNEFKRNSKEVTRDLSKRQPTRWESFSISSQYWAYTKMQNTLEIVGDRGWQKENFFAKWISILSQKRKDVSSRFSDALRNESEKMDIANDLFNRMVMAEARKYDPATLDGFLGELNDIEYNNMLERFNIFAKSLDSKVDRINENLRKNYTLFAEADSRINFAKDFQNQEDIPYSTKLLDWFSAAKHKVKLLLKRDRSAQNYRDTEKAVWKAYRSVDYNALMDINYYKYRLRNTYKYYYYTILRYRIKRRLKKLKKKRQKFQKRIDWTLWYTSQWLPSVLHAQTTYDKIQIELLKWEKEVQDYTATINNVLTKENALDICRWRSKNWWKLEKGLYIYLYQLKNAETRTKLKEEGFSIEELRGKARSKYLELHTDATGRVRGNIESFDDVANDEEEIILAGEAANYQRQHKVETDNKKKWRKLLNPVDLYKYITSSPDQEEEEIRKSRPEGFETLHIISDKEKKELGIHKEGALEAVEDDIETGDWRKDRDGIELVGENLIIRRVDMLNDNFKDWALYHDLFNRHKEPTLRELIKILWYQECFEYDIWKGSLKPFVAIGSFTQNPAYFKTYQSNNTKSPFNVTPDQGDWFSRNYVNYPDLPNVINKYDFGRTTISPLSLSDYLPYSFGTPELHMDDWTETFGGFNQGLSMVKEHITVKGKTVGECAKERAKIENKRPKIELYKDLEKCWKLIYYHYPRIKWESSDYEPKNSKYWNPEGSLIGSVSARLTWRKILASPLWSDYTLRRRWWDAPNLKEVKGHRAIRTFQEKNSRLLKLEDLALQINTSVLTHEGGLIKGLIKNQPKNVMVNINFKDFEDYKINHDFKRSWSRAFHFLDNVNTPELMKFNAGFKQQFESVKRENEYFEKYKLPYDQNLNMVNQQLKEFLKTRKDINPNHEEFKDPYKLAKKLQAVKSWLIREQFYNNPSAVDDLSIDILLEYYLSYDRETNPEKYKRLEDYQKKIVALGQGAASKLLNVDDQGRYTNVQTTEDYINYLKSIGKRPGDTLTEKEELTFRHMGRTRHGYDFLQFKRYLNKELTVAQEKQYIREMLRDPSIYFKNYKIKQLEVALTEDLNKVGRKLHRQQGIDSKRWLDGYRYGAARTYLYQQAWKFYEGKLHFKWFDMFQSVLLRRFDLNLHMVKVQTTYVIAFLFFLFYYSLKDLSFFLQTTRLNLKPFKIYPGYEYNQSEIEESSFLVRTPDEFNYEYIYDYIWGEEKIAYRWVGGIDWQWDIPEETQYADDIEDLKKNLHKDTQYWIKPDYYAGCHPYVGSGVYVLNQDVLLNDHFINSSKNDEPYYDRIEATGFHNEDYNTNYYYLYNVHGDLKTKQYAKPKIEQTMPLNIEATYFGITPTENYYRSTYNQKMIRSVDYSHSLFHDVLLLRRSLFEEAVNSYNTLVYSYNIQITFESYLKYKSIFDYYVVAGKNEINKEFKYLERIDDQAKRFSSFLNMQKFNILGKLKKYTYNNQIEKKFMSDDDYLINYFRAILIILLQHQNLLELKELKQDLYNDQSFIKFLVDISEKYPLDLDPMFLVFIKIILNHYYNIFDINNEQIIIKKSPYFLPTRVFILSLLLSDKFYSQKNFKLIDINDLESLKNIELNLQSLLK